MFGVLFITFIVNTIPVEEKLVYTAKYGVLSIGEIKLEIKRDSLNYIRCEEETKGFFNYIFRIKDWYESVTDSNFVTQRFEKHIEEGKYRAHEVITIKDSFAIYNGQDTVDVTPGAKDIISIIYWLRTQELIPGDTIYIPLHEGKRNHIIKVRIERWGFNGEYYLVAIPELQHVKTFGTAGGLILYYEPESMVPVRLKIKFKWGHIQAELKRREWK